MLIQIPFSVRANCLAKQLSAIAMSMSIGMGLAMVPGQSALSTDGMTRPPEYPQPKIVEGELVRTARYRTPSELLAEAERMVLLGDIERAIAAYEEVQILNGFFGIGANSWNKLCWYGSLWGYAGDVIHACESAVDLAPDNINIIDSRGLARALSGDREGAISDFTTFVEGAQNDTRKFQRQEWIDALKEGENPFTPDVVRLLFIE
ncbi:hypothetical protein IQ235_09695 [Oscillatoriales cyanobacterium LEGE 11467]|uniref:Tetratricopeptide repeat protein n=1 Tax=Zarconia navalis LEGE 11467 TaxID=1828826 RepID=A0A928Z9S3_9CYAN|nr:hypothetical protein [Zarconia navalis]MBE9041051.1 hypothetical protein [Zarconia navalis LEGE 11467]